MSNDSKPSKLLIAAGVLCAMTATAGFLSTEPIMLQCTKHCWFNSLLYAFFGENGARIGILIVGYMISLSFFYFAWKRRD